MNPSNESRLVPHSSGEWTVDVWDYSHDKPPRKELLVQNGSLVIATLNWDEGKENPYVVPHDEAHANARLIAAAPRLLAALEALVSEADLGELDLEPEEQALLQAGRDAVSKAKGIK